MQCCCCLGLRHRIRRNVDGCTGQPFAVGNTPSSVAVSPREVRLRDQHGGQHVSAFTLDPQPDLTKVPARLLNCNQPVAIAFGRTGPFSTWPISIPTTFRLLDRCHRPAHRKRQFALQRRHWAGVSRLDPIGNRLSSASRTESRLPNYLRLQLWRLKRPPPTALA